MSWKVLAELQFFHAQSQNAIRRIEALFAILTIELKLLVDNGVKALKGLLNEEAID